jgi:GT2 family glycosyltransferase
MKLFLLVACFNRVETTLANLRTLFEVFDRIRSVELRVFLVDDASPDRTGDAVRRAFPQVEVIDGTGSLWWNRSMCLAYRKARAAGPCDAYLLFNDDVSLDTEGVSTCLDTFRQFNLESPSIVVGPTLAPDRQSTTFSAYLRPSAFRPLKLARLLPNGSPRIADTFNGNFVLVPQPLMDALGGPDPKFHQQFADLDMGFCAKRLGGRVVLCGQHVGVCAIGAPRLPSRSFRKRAAELFGPPTPVSDYIHFVFKHSAWPFAIALGVRYTVLRALDVLRPRARSPVFGPTRPKEIE